MFETSMNVDRILHGAAVLNGRMYVAGGQQFNGAAQPGAVLDSVEVFEPRTGQPAAPTNLQFTLNGATLALTWSAPTTGEIPTSYIIEAGSQPGTVDIASLDLGNTATALTVPNVPAGTYYIRVKARSASAVSVASNEIVVVVEPHGVCPAPSGLTATVSGSSLTLQWIGVAGALTYLVDVGTAPGVTNVGVFDLRNTMTSISAPNMPNGTYYLRVRAVTACGTSDPSNEVVAFIGDPPPGGLTGRWVGLQANGDGATSTPNECGVERWDWVFDLVQTGTAVSGTLTQTVVASGCDPIGRVQSINLAGTVSGNDLTLTDASRRMELTATFSATRMTGIGLVGGGAFGRVTFAVNKVP
jgi:hypothetical protein